MFLNLPYRSTISCSVLLESGNFSNKTAGHSDIASFYSFEFLRHLFIKSISSYQVLFVNFKIWGDVNDLKVFNPSLGCNCLQHFCSGRYAVNLDGGLNLPRGAILNFLTIFDKATRFHFVYVTFLFILAVSLNLRQVASVCLFGVLFLNWLSRDGSFQGE